MQSSKKRKNCIHIHTRKFIKRNQSVIYITTTKRKSREREKKKALRNKIKKQIHTQHTHVRMQALETSSTSAINLFATVFNAVTRAQNNNENKKQNYEKQKTEKRRKENYYFNFLLDVWPNKEKKNSFCFRFYNSVRNSK